VGDYIPKYSPGEAISLSATATVTGGLLVTVAGAVAGANETTWLGVASRDAITGQTFGVYTEGVQKLIASGAVTAGDRLKCAAGGKVSTLTAGSDAYDRLVGIALETAIDAALLRVKLIR
jgi:hypothetical protein